MDDLISRQAAVDAIQRERDFLIKRGLNGAEHILTHHAYNIIADLPSAQPEIIRCKDCYALWRIVARRRHKDDMPQNSAQL